MWGLVDSGGLVSHPCDYLAVMNVPPLPPPPTVAPVEPAVPVEDREVRLTEVAAVIGQLTASLAGGAIEAAGEGDLLALVEALAPVIDRLTAVQAVAVGAVDARGAAITREGLLTDAWLQLVARRAGGDRKTLLVAGDVLPTMPHVRQAALTGRLSWSEVRVICLKAVRLSQADRNRLDELVAGDLETTVRMGAEDVLELLDRFLADLKPDTVERREDREFTSQYLALIPHLDGTGELHGELDAVTFTGVAGAITTVAEQLATPPEDEDAPRWQSKGQRQALALHHLVTRDGDGPGTTAQVLVTVEQPETGEPTITLHHRRGRRAMSAAALWRLAAQAELRVLITTGGVPLKVGRTRRAATRAQRAAAAVLYGGCAWPGCPAPMSVCELHHVIPWQPPWYGRTDDTNLVPICPVHHHAVTHGKWKLVLNPDRSVTVTRGRRKHTSLPRARAPDRQPRAPDPPLPF
jgi:hypothetical protein